MYGEDRSPLDRLKENRLSLITKDSRYITCHEPLLLIQSRYARPPWSRVVEFLTCEKSDKAGRPSVPSR